MEKVKLQLRSQLFKIINRDKIRPYWQTTQILYYRSKIALNPSDANAYSRLGYILSRQKKLPEAVAACHRAIELNPNIFQPYFYLGEALLQQKQWSEAISRFNRAIELNPQNSASRHLLKKASAQQKQSETIKSLKRAIELNPQDSWSYYQLGVALFKQGQWQEAAQVLSQEIELNSTNRHSYDLLAQALDKLSDNSIQNTISQFKTLNQKLIAATHPHFQIQSNNASALRQPHFLIVGQLKCGTTSLYYYLTQHPQILPSIKKEIHFWNDLYNQGLDWYLAHFPAINLEQNFITGEATTSYLNYPKIAKNIIDNFPKIQIIILLRNPVERTLSDYYMFCRDLGETRSIEEAIISKLANINNQQQTSVKQKLELSKYVMRSQYIDLIRQWMEVVPQEQFLILKSEDLFSEPEKIVNQVFEFLAVEPYQLSEYKKVNAASYPDISESDRQALQDYFRPYNHQLEAYLGKKFNWYS